MSTRELVPAKDPKTGERAPYLFVDTSSKDGIIQFERRYRGRKIKFSTHTSNIVVAKRFANEEFERRIGKRKIQLNNLLIDELNHWKKIKQAEGLKSDTLKNVRNAIKQIQPFWGSKFPTEIGRESIAEWIGWFKKTYPDQQMENAIKYFRNFCRYLSEKVVNGRPLLPGIPTIKDPDAKTVRQERKKKKERVFTHDEFCRVLAVCDDTERIILLFMYTMALRITQCLELRWEQLDLEAETYRFRDGDNKANLDGIQDIHSSLVPLLKARKQNAKNHWVFPQLTKDQPLKEQQIDWDGLRQKANLGWHWTAHTYLHTCLTNLFNNEQWPHALILKLYRISLPTALETYIKVTPEGRRKMKNAIEV